MSLKLALNCLGLIATWLSTQKRIGEELFFYFCLYYQFLAKVIFIFLLIVTQLQSLLYSCTLHCFNAKQFIHVKSNQMLEFHSFILIRVTKVKTKQSKSWTKPLQKFVKWRGKVRGASWKCTYAEHSLPIFTVMSVEPFLKKTRKGLLCWRQKSCIQLQISYCCIPTLMMSLRFLLFLSFSLAKCNEISYRSETQNYWL